MTEFEYISICMEHLIDPALALEEPKVVEALKSQASLEEMGKILQENF